MDGDRGANGRVTDNSRRQAIMPVLLSLALLLIPVTARAQAERDTEVDASSAGLEDERTADPEDAADDDDLDEVPETEEEALDRVQQPFTELPPEPEPPERDSDAPIGVFEDPCDADYSEPHWQEDTQEFFRDISCHSFRWTDSLFGSDIDYPENEVSGLAVLGGSWNEYEGFDSRLRFRVRAPLPNMDRRWDLILGRDDEDAFIQDTQAQDATFYNPGVFNRGDSDSLILGLGGRRRGADRNGWDWSAGVRLRSRPVPYVRLRYFYSKVFSPETDLRARQTFFWRSDDGFGTTTRADLAHAFRPQDVMRWEGVATINEVSPGVEWYVGQTWFHLMEDRRAFSVLAFANGETDGLVELREAGFNFIWRQPFTRDWIWLSYGPSATWPRFEPEDKRELSLGFTVQLEMEFGSWVYR